MKKNNDYADDLLIRKNILEIIENLCQEESYTLVYHRSNHDMAMPSLQHLSEILDLLKSVLFPGYFGNSEVKPETMQYYLGAAIDRVFLLLSEEIKRGFCFVCRPDEYPDCTECERRARSKAAAFLKRLPHIRYLLSTDIRAAFEGDPAAKSHGEIIFSYPSIKALTVFRVAHELFELEVPLIPRIMTELAHSETGIDIHPGAQIGERFFIDHGTGVVIGETAVIGSDVTLYQGVTLGAKSFPLDEQGNPVKGIPRHPVVEDNVIIYSGATVLGRITIGKGSVIGGNVWLTHDVPPGTRVLQGRAEEDFHRDGSGI